MENNKIHLSPDYVCQPISNLIETCHSSTLIGLRAIEKITEHPQPTIEEQQLIQFGTLKEKDIEICKREFKSWILIKGFEEIHNAIRDSLERFLIFISIYDWIKQNSFDKEAFESFIKEITVKIKKQNHPTLLKNIIKKTDEKLLYQEQIETINNARNCLVHEFGIIKSNHCNNLEKDELWIKANKFCLFYKNQNSEKLHPFKIGEIISESIYLFTIAEEVTFKFKVGEVLTLSYENYISLLSTCVFYERDLREKIKRCCV